MCGCEGQGYLYYLCRMHGYRERKTWYGKRVSFGTECVEDLAHKHHREGAVMGIWASSDRYGEKNRQLWCACEKKVYRNFFAECDLKIVHQRIEEVENISCVNDDDGCSGIRNECEVRGGSNDFMRFIKIEGQGIWDGRI